MTFNKLNKVRGFNKRIQSLKLDRKIVETGKLSKRRLISQLNKFLKNKYLFAIILVIQMKEV